MPSLLRGPHGGNLASHASGPDTLAIQPICLPNTHFLELQNFPTP